MKSDKCYWHDEMLQILTNVVIKIINVSDLKLDSLKRGKYVNVFIHLTIRFLVAV